MFNQQDNESEQPESSIKSSENMYQGDQVGNSNFNQTNILQGNQNQAASSRISQKSASTNVTTNSQNSQETDEPSGLSQQLQSQESKYTQSTIQVMNVQKPKGGSPPISKSQVVTPCEPKSKSQK